MDRGVSLEKARISFLNAGYLPEEIESAIKKVSVPDISFSKIPEPGVQSKTTIQSQKTGDSAAAGLQKTSNKITTIGSTQQKKKGVSKKLMIILGIVSLVILIVAGILGFFWDEIFK